MSEFSHLHCHSQFSLLDGASKIDAMFKKAAADEMPALAITDHGNMFGAFKFVAEAWKKTKVIGKDADGKDILAPVVKPIVGCEFYVVADRTKKSFTKEDKDQRFHQLFLAKNAIGYKNLSKMCSLGYMEGLYGKYPRIDKTLILKYHEGLIATTCCIGAEVPQAILNQGEEKAEELFKWWLDIFGEDYYIELQRHGLKEQEKVNEVLLRFAKKYNVHVIATNDSHYVNEEDANAHDILLCINTGELQSTPVWRGNDDEKMPKGYRFGFPNQEFYFKTTAQMSTLFKDVPQSIDNTQRIVDKIETLNLHKDVLLPGFPVPKEFLIHQNDQLNQWEYLKFLTMEGARKRYQEITPEIEERINFELHTIKTMGFAGYFLIVSDFIKAGRNMGVLVGPGRGSAAGSVVAYCIAITNIDPIAYNLLFERFLNPDRKEMPDIDTDFDDAGRQKVIDYVVEKYGKNQVAQIVTYGTMAAKMSIKDVARVLDLPLQDSNILAKMVPDKPGIELNRVLKAPLEGEGSLSDPSKEGITGADLDPIKQLREILAGHDLRARVLKEALILEGSVRGTGVHAAGIIIAPQDLSELMPVAVAKDSELLLTQFEGKVIEKAGVIKMDFLGLKTLTIIKNTLVLIEKNHGLVIDMDLVDLTDAKTFEIFQRGDTYGIFQFESLGMQKYMKELKPDRFQDIIAMNALYRPGPIEYIPSYIKRKHGLEPVSFDLDVMEEYLADTFGITVYQEQVMLLSQKIAHFSKGDADVLRKAMGKKDRKTLDKLKPRFINQAVELGHALDKLEKIWTDWEAFASYAFNKSHSTCYAFVAFQTAWLKAHYPSEYMAANLSNEKDNIEKMTPFLEEAQKMGIAVLGPDINESSLNFDVNKQGQIRFGLGGIKGLGESAVESLIEEREKNGPYLHIFDFAKRVNQRVVNKKAYESLALAGGFDCFTDMHRAQFFHTENGDKVNFIEKLIRYGQVHGQEKDTSQHSLFGGGGAHSDTMIPLPKVPKCDMWGDLERLRLEKDVIGLYISGHPLDQYKFDIDHFCTCTVSQIELQGPKDPTSMETVQKDIYIAGMLTRAESRQAQSGNTFGIYVIEDHTGIHEFTITGKDFLKFGYMMVLGQFYYVQAKVVPHFRFPDKYTIRPQNIEMLSEIRKSKCKGVVLKMDLTKTNRDTLDTLENLVHEHEGNVTLKMEAYDPMFAVQLLSKRYRIDPSNAFFDGLKELDDALQLKIES